jgi:hypothetical protein
MSQKSKSLPTLNDIRVAHGSKREYERYLPLSRFIFRPLGFLLTWVAIRIGLTTEAVAWVSGIVGISGCICLISGHESLPPVGIGLLLFFNLLDCVDGSIARVMKTENPYGRFLDSICGGIIDLEFWGIIGIMAFRHPQQLYFPNPFGLGSLLWLTIGGLTCFFCIWLGYTERTFDELLRPYWEKIQQANRKRQVTGTVLEKAKPGTNAPQTSDWRMIIRTINTNMRVRETNYLLLILAFCLNMVDFLLFLYFCYYLFYSLILLGIYCFRGVRTRDSLRKGLQ